MTAVVVPRDLRGPAVGGRLTAGGDDVHTFPADFNASSESPRRASGVGQPGMLREVLAVRGDGAGLAVFGHAVGVAPAGWAGDDDGAGWCAPALGAAELDTARVMAVVSWW